MAKVIYDAGFYDGQSSGSDRSARAIVPLIVELFKPRSVLDVGCGTGKWCKAFADHGVATVTGLDGPWVAPEAFALGRENFVTYDFNAVQAPFAPKLSAPRYDLVVSFEFIEHIEPQKAPALVKFLTSLAPIVVAGGAIPGQGGRHHVNEQWPSYWRALFETEGFKAYDCLRPLIWDNPIAEAWYLQNAIAYFRDGAPATVVDRAKRAVVARLSDPAPLVHPRLLAFTQDPRNHAVASHLRGANMSFMHRVRNKLKS